MDEGGRGRAVEGGMTHRAAPALRLSDADPAGCGYLSVRNTFARRAACEVSESDRRGGASPPAAPPLSPLYVRGITDR